MIRHLRAGAALVALCAVAGRATAQVSLGPTTPRFAAIARLAQDAYGDSARTLISHILAATPATDPSYPEALYTAGTVARTGDSMRAIFSRLVVDHAQSPWADKSLLRLVQLDYGLGKMDAVMNETNRVFTDYPDSPVMPNAALWGARAAFSLQKMQIGCGWLTKAIAAVGDDLELKNQLLFAKQSCDLGPGVVYAPVVPESLRAGPPPRNDTGSQPVAPRATPTPKTKTATATTASPWRVQVAAIRDQAVIRQISRKLEAAGFKVYTVPGPGGLVRVQAGPFLSRAAAAAAVARVKRAAGGKPIVVAAP
jgi:cell division septation protein DedD